MTKATCRTVCLKWLKSAQPQWSLLCTTCTQIISHTKTVKTYMFHISIMFLSPVVTASPSNFYFCGMIYICVMWYAEHLLHIKCSKHWLINMLLKFGSMKNYKTTDVTGCDKYSKIAFHCTVHYKALLLNENSTNLNPSNAVANIIIQTALVCQPPLLQQLHSLQLKAAASDRQQPTSVVNLCLEPSRCALC